MTDARGDRGRLSLVWTSHRWGRAGRTPRGTTTRAARAMPGALAHAAATTRWAVTVDGDPSAALLVRVWFEAGSEAFRSRITSLDTTPGRPDAEEVTVAVASSPADVVDAVRAWLADLQRDAPDGEARA